MALISQSGNLARQRPRDAARDRLPHRRLDRQPGGRWRPATGSTPSPGSTGCARSRSSSRRTATAPASPARWPAAPSARSASPSSRSAPRRPAPAPPAPTPGRVAGDQRVFSALLEEAGAAEARDPQELLELARCLAATRPRAAARWWARRPHLLGRRLGPCRRPRRARGPAAAGAGAGDPGPAGRAAARRRHGRQPARLHDDALGRDRDPRAGRRGGRLRSRDRPAAAAVRRARGPLRDRQTRLGRRSAARSSPGAERSGAEPLLASTVPDLLPERSALELAERGIAAAAGLREAIRCAAALSSLRPTPGAPRARSPQPPSAVAGDGDGAWLGEAETKRLLADAGASGARVRGRRRGRCGGRPGGRDRGPGRGQALEPRPAPQERGGGDRPRPRGGEPRSAPRPSASSPCPRRTARPSSSRLWPAARSSCSSPPAATGSCPRLVVGLGGIWTEALDDVAIIPLPASPERVERALAGLRGARRFCAAAARLRSTSRRPRHSPPGSASSCSRTTST